MEPLFVGLFVAGVIVVPAVGVLVLRDLINRGKITKEERRFATVMAEDDVVAGEWGYEFEIVPTKQERRQILRYHERDTLGHPVVRILLLPLMIWAIYGGVQATLSGRLAGAGLVLLACLGIWLLIVNPLLMRLCPSDRAEGSFRPNIGRIDRDGLRFGGRPDVIPWAQVRRWRCRKHGILFELAGNERIFLPRSSFASDDELAQFLKVLGRIAPGR